MSEMFPSWTWQMCLMPTVFAGMKQRSSTKKSQYSGLGQNNIATLHGPTLAAVTAYMSLDTSIYPNNTATGGFGSQSDQFYMGEYPYWEDNAIHVVMFNVYLLCDPDFEKLDFVGGFIPKICRDEVSTPGIPTYDHIRLDPPSAWLTLTGENNPTVTATEVYARLLEVLEEQTASNAAGHDSESYLAFLSGEFDRIAKHFRAHLEMDKIYEILNGGALYG